MLRSLLLDIIDTMDNETNETFYYDEIIPLDNDTHHGMLRLKQPTLQKGFTRYILDFFLNYTLGFLPNKEGVMVLLSLFKNGVLQDLYL
mgnify:CR=1 FL=1